MFYFLAVELLPLLQCMGPGNSPLMSIETALVTIRGFSVCFLLLSRSGFRVSLFWKLLVSLAMTLGALLVAVRGIFWHYSLLRMMFSPVPQPQETQPDQFVIGTLNAIPSNNKATVHRIMDHRTVRSLPIF
jgi:hypothetical protein